MSADVTKIEPLQTLNMDGLTPILDLEGTVGFPMTSDELLIMRDKLFMFVTILGEEILTLTLGRISEGDPSKMLILTDPLYIDASMPYISYPQMHIVNKGNPPYELRMFRVDEDIINLVEAGLPSSVSGDRKLQDYLSMVRNDIARITI